MGSESVKPSLQIFNNFKVKSRPVTCYRSPMDGVMYLTEIKASDKYNNNLSEAFNDSYGTKAKVILIYRVPKGKKTNEYQESVTTFKQGGKSVTLYEFLKEPNGLTDYVTLMYGGADRRFNTYAEAEQEVVNIFKEKV